MGRIFGGQCFVIQAIFLEAAELEVFHHHVAVTGDHSQSFGALRRGHVHSDGSLVAICTEVIGAFSGVVAVFVLDVWWPPIAGAVAGARAQS